MRRREPVATPRWEKALGWAVGLLVAGAGAWLLFWPASVPACNAHSTRRSVETLFLATTLRANELLGSEERSARPVVGPLTEVGYAGALRVRACKTTVKLDGDVIPYAFTIAPGTGRKGGFVISGGEPRIIEARFGHIDDDGQFGNRAEPLGRAEVERAFRAGVDTASQPFDGIALYGPRMPNADIANAVNRKFGLPYGTPERARPIAEVEPIGPCRPLEGQRVYSCRLLVERNDRFAATLGAVPSIVLDAEFTFERGDAPGQWRTTAAFSDEYAKAIVAAWKQGR